MSVLKNVKMNWIKIIEPDEYKGTKSWQLTATVSKAQAKELVDAGANPKKGESGGPTIFVLKRYCKWPSGEWKNPPKQLDSSKNVIDFAVANEAEGHIQFAKVTYPGGKMVDLQAIMYTKFEKYGGSDGDELDEFVDSGTEFDESPEPVKGEEPEKPKGDGQSDPF